MEMNKNRGGNKTIKESVMVKQKEINKQKESNKQKDTYKMDIEVTLIEHLLGTISKDEETFTSYIKNRAKGKETLDEFHSPLDQEGIEEREQKGCTGFHKDEKGEFVFDYYIQGFLKHVGNLLKDGEHIKVKNVKSKISDRIFVYPRKIYLDGKRSEKPLERPIKCMTPQGPRVSLKKSDQFEPGTKLKFQIVCPVKCEIKPNHIESILKYGQFHGLGQFRNGGYGRFKYKLLAIENFSL